MPKAVMRKKTKAEKIKEIVSDVYDYDLETLIQCAVNHETAYWNKQSAKEIDKVHAERFPLQEE